MRPSPWLSRLLSVACLLLAAALVGCDDEDGPWLSIDSPSDGARWAASSSESILWRSQGVGQIRIEFSRDGGQTWEELAGSVPASVAAYEWMVVALAPPPLPQRDCLVRVSDATTGSPSATAGVVLWNRAWRVDDDAAAGGDGLSWDQAFTHPQDAVDAAAPGDEVWVAAGSYTRRSPEDRRILTMKDSVSVYGGFDAVPRQIETRDWEANVTILDGEGFCYKAVMGASESAVDGFRIVGCVGSGVYSFRASNLTIANCVFEGNSAASTGGGVCVSDSDVAIINCGFADNAATDWGGGVNASRSTLRVLGCKFSGNTARVGAGIELYVSSVELVNCEFTGNTALEDGGGVSGEGGWPTALVVRNCTFAGNSAGRGGGLFLLTTSVDASNCILWDNRAASSGPEVYSEDVSPEVLVHSCARGGWVGEENIGGDLVNDDPLFVDPGYWHDNATPGDPSDDYWVSPPGDGDYHLSASSPCIDTGTAVDAPATDLDGNPRPSGSRHDMGAYEFQQ